MTDNPKKIHRIDSDKPVLTEDVCVLHRRRTIFLVRHGEAVHNVLEAKAQAKAREEAQAQGLSEEETAERMEEARKDVLKDVTLRDAPLTDLGREQAADTGRRLQEIINQGSLPPPSEAVVSPLSRTLETCDILLENVDVDLKAHIRHEIQERQTLKPPDTARSRKSILHFSQTNHKFSFQVNDEKPTEADIQQEAEVRESKEMLRERASKLFDLLLEMEHVHILIVSHKGYLRELERGLFGLTDSPLFSNGELRVYRVEFTRGARTLEALERVA